jgi:uncharacterized protein YciI
MYFAIMAWDRPEMFAVRRDVKQRHVAHLDAPGPDLKVLQSGPLLDDQSREIGSLVIVDAPDRAAVEAFADGDPYRHAGIVERRLVQPWAWKRGNPHIVRPNPATASGG